MHIAQRDREETQHYHSQDIRSTGIRCFDLAFIRTKGTDAIFKRTDTLDVDSCWIHFDTDVLDDAINPAVDYRLPGGLSFDEAAGIIHRLLQTGRIAGISISNFHPSLDQDGRIAQNIVTCLGKAFDLNK